MKLYPDVPAPRTRTVLRDLAALVCILVFAWLGLRVYHDVDRLSALGMGVSQAGAGIGSGFSTAAGAASNVPIVGDALAGALRSAGSTAAGNVEAIGQTGQQDAHHLARVLGILTWALPTVLLLLLVLPGRIRQIRRLTEAQRAADASGAPEQQRLIALRALLTLPDRALLAHTPDPAGDMLAGRYEGLVAAGLESAGVRASAGRRGVRPAVGG